MLGSDGFVEILDLLPLSLNRFLITLHFQYTITTD